MEEHPIIKIRVLILVVSLGRSEVKSYVVWYGTSKEKYVHAFYSWYNRLFVLFMSYVWLLCRFHRLFLCTTITTTVTNRHLLLTWESRVRHSLGHESCVDALFCSPTGHNPDNVWTAVKDSIREVSDWILDARRDSARLLSVVMWSDW